MPIASWIELISLVLKFPSSALALMKYLAKTPEEKHQEMIGAVDAWMEKSQSSDRPVWEHP